MAIVTFFTTFLGGGGGVCGKDELIFVVFIYILISSLGLDLSY